MLVLESTVMVGAASGRAGAGGGAGARAAGEGKAAFRWSETALGSAGLVVKMRPEAVMSLPHRGARAELVSLGLLLLRQVFNRVEG
jgi:hypothetical protein